MEPDERPGSSGLGPLEMRVMEQLWQRGRSTPREVLDGLNRSGQRALAYTTVTTILVRLHEKGLVERQPMGRQYAYRATVGRDDVAAVVGRRALERLLERYGTRAVAGFAAELLPADHELRQRLERLAVSDAEE